ncbi:MAG TPA: alpha/beta hydrolase [Polyangia bacterium]|nr:alpha/beta hydrolase [Polyangia bacterium]
MTSYDDRGNGPALVLLHPFPFSHGIWSGVGDALAAHLRVVSIDARGFGRSPLTGAATIADLADDVAALLDELRIERAAVLGMSMGGYGALAFAARHPARLAALVLCDTRADGDPPAMRAARDGAIARIRDEGVDAYLPGSIPRLLSPDAPPALWAHLLARAEARGPSLIAGIEALRDRPDRTGDLAAIRCPALVIRGAGDQVTPADVMQKMADGIAGARFVTLPGAGHLSHIEAPGPFLEAVGGFLSSALAGGSR